MLMTAAVHMDSSSVTTSPPPRWLPVLGGHQLLHDFTPASASSPSTPPSSHHHHLVPLRAAPSSVRRRVANKRRPRPSRRLPTTYISADPANFRRMVHQVTGASDDLLLARPAPVRAAATGGSTTGALVNINTLLPTLDTSAFLAGALSRTGTDAPSCDASGLKTMEAGGACNSSTGGGFPTLDSWDHHAPLY